MALNFHPLVIIGVSVILQKSGIWTWYFFQLWENCFPEFILCWRGWDGVNPVPSQLPQKNCCPAFWLTEPRPGQLMPQPRQIGREDMLNHTNDFFPHLSFFALWFVILCDTWIYFFNFFFNSKALFIYLMYTAKLGEKGVVTWDYFFFWFVIC